MDENEYLEKFFQEEVSIKTIEDELNKLKKAKALVNKAIPDSVCLGIVTVRCKDVRRKLDAKYKLIMSKELEMYSKQLKTKCDLLSKEFKVISNSLKEEAGNIEDMTNIVRFMDEIPAKV